jgi:hypothetical protein
LADLGTNRQGPCSRSSSLPCKDKHELWWLTSKYPNTTHTTLLVTIRRIVLVVSLCLSLSHFSPSLCRVVLSFVFLPLSGTHTHKRTCNTRTRTASTLFQHVHTCNITNTQTRTNMLTCTLQAPLLEPCCLLDFVSGSKYVCTRSTHKEEKRKGESKRERGERERSLPAFLGAPLLAELSRALSFSSHTHTRTQTHKEPIHTRAHTRILKTPLLEPWSLRPLSGSNDVCRERERHTPAALSVSLSLITTHRHTHTPTHKHTHTQTHYTHTHTLRT